MKSLFSSGLGLNFSTCQVGVLITLQGLFSSIFWAFQVVLAHESKGQVKAGGQELRVVSNLLGCDPESS